MHRDYRDHYRRAGWSAFLRIGRPGIPTGLTLSYGEFEVSSAAARDPFTIFYNNHAWRREPSIGAARFTTLNTEFLYDTRNDERDPAAGWLLGGTIEMELKGSQRYRYGVLDLRRYARLSPNAKISMRGLLAGSVNGDALPVFRQQSIGGEGSLPGYELYQFDCGGHGSPAAAPELDFPAPYYGCDRVALVQLEYQSNFSALSRVARQLGRDFGMLNNIRWVAFANSGRAWTEPGRRPVVQSSRGLSDFVTDVGVGLRFGVVGAYWAFPLSDRGTSTNFFVRLGPRL